MKTLILLLTIGGALSAQQPSTSDPTLQSLLAEVHQLRLALERSTLIGPRIQIAVERVKIQNEVVARLSRQADEARQSTETAQSFLARMATRIAALEADERVQTDPGQRKRLESELADSHAEADQAQKVQQLAQSHREEAESHLRSEQAILDSLNDRLTQIERTLELPPK